MLMFEAVPVDVARLVVKKPRLGKAPVMPATPAGPSKQKEKEVEEPEDSEPEEWGGPTGRNEGRD